MTAAHKLLLAASMLTCASAHADLLPRGHVGGGVSAHANVRRSLKLDATPSAERIVLVLDPRRLSSLRLLEAVRAEDLRGAGVAVVVLDEGPTAAAFLRGHQSTLPQARWLLMSAAALRKQIALPVTPVVIGRDADEHVIWRHEGLPERPRQLVLQIAEWSLSGGE